ncbi:hypothetical protein SS50377_25020 [Spironucleus salmonicida]|uniref:Myb-like DNA-binding domain-containing protein n=1 Tax=Spironucleus salmonicida TaxID=348837 RepID=V6LFK3_9EUKA|nr:hypothetical protein SS50377_25020 [Spironucleus salmonicida]|eukprot:EST43073.1 Hypothetical protein SS50377_17231 [Spironucleus salmonicida]
MKTEELAQIIEWIYQKHINDYAYRGTYNNAYKITYFNIQKFSRLQLLKIATYNNIEIEETLREDIYQKFKKDIQQLVTQDNLFLLDFHKVYYLDEFRQIFIIQEIQEIKTIDSVQNFPYTILNPTVSEDNQIFVYNYRLDLISYCNKKLLFLEFFLKSEIVIQTSNIQYHIRQQVQAVQQSFKSKQQKPQQYNIWTKQQRQIMITSVALYGYNLRKIQEESLQTKTVQQLKNQYFYLVKCGKIKKQQ